MHFNEYGLNVCRKALCVIMVPLLSALVGFFFFFENHVCNLGHGCKSHGDDNMNSVILDHVDLLSMKAHVYKKEVL